MTNSNLIYESNDGGKTIYSRKFGSIDRTIMKKNPEHERIERIALWCAILELAETDASINDAVSYVEVIYELTKSK